MKERKKTTVFFSGVWGLPARALVFKINKTIKGLKNQQHNLAIANFYRSGKLFILTPLALFCHWMHMVFPCNITPILILILISVGGRCNTQATSENKTTKMVKKIALGM